MNKKDKIDTFLETLKSESCNEFGRDTDRDVKDVFTKHFAIFCRKCGSGDMYLNFEEGVDYGEYTGSEPGKAIIKCKGCGNTASIYL